MKNKNRLFRWICDVLNAVLKKKKNLRPVLSAYKLWLVGNFLMWRNYTFGALWTDQEEKYTDKYVVDNE